MDLIMFNDNILVSELTDDLMNNGTAVMYDSESPYMFCRVEKIAESLAKQYDIYCGDVIVIKRYAKEEFLPGLYFISVKDVRCKVPKEVYDNLVINN